MDRWINGQDTARANLLVLILNIGLKCCFVFKLHSKPITVPRSVPKAVLPVTAKPLAPADVKGWVRLNFHKIILDIVNLKVEYFNLYEVINGYFSSQMSLLLATA